MKLLDRLRGSVETERLLLRKWRQEDFVDFQRMVMDEELMLAAGAGPCPDVKAVKRRFRRAVQEGYAIIWKDNGQAIGNFQFARDMGRLNVTSFIIGYWLEKPYWGQGAMTEVLGAMVRHGFEKKKAEVLAVGHAVGNEGSRRVIEKCGFTHEGTRRQALRRSDGAVLDEEIYSILREEFLAGHGHREVPVGGRANMKDLLKVKKMEKWS